MSFAMKTFENKPNFKRFVELAEVDIRYLSYGKVVSALRVLELIEKNRLQGETILDIGCGAGGISQFFDDFVGVEISHKALSNASRINERNNATFVCGNAEYVPLKDGVTDFVISVNMLEHTSDPGKVIDEIYRLTNRIALIVVPCSDCVPFFYDPFNWSRIKLGYKPRNRGAFGYGHINLRSHDEWLELLAKANFTLLEEYSYDDSLIGQIEFCLFSLLKPSDEYEDLPIRSVMKRKYHLVSVLHRLAWMLDYITSASFSRCFLVKK